MRKSVIAVTAALVGMLVAAPMASAAPGDSDTGRACADIDGARVNYQSLPLGDPIPPSESAEVLAEVDLRADACKNVSYTMAIYRGISESGTPVTTSGVPAQTSAGTPAVTFLTPVPWFTLPDLTTTPPTPGDFVCVVFTTSKSNGGVIDRAPDAGCIDLGINSTIAGSTKFR